MYVIWLKRNCRGGGECHIKFASAPYRQAASRLLSNQKTLYRWIFTLYIFYSSPPLKCPLPFVAGGVTNTLVRLTPMRREYENLFVNYSNKVVARLFPLARYIELHTRLCVVLCLEVSHKLSLGVCRAGCSRCGRQHLFYDMEWLTQRQSRPLLYTLLRSRFPAVIFAYGSEVSDVRACIASRKRSTPKFWEHTSRVSKQTTRCSSLSWKKAFCVRDNDFLSLCDDAHRRLRDYCYTFALPWRRSATNRNNALGCYALRVRQQRDNIHGCCVCVNFSVTQRQPQLCSATFLEKLLWVHFCWALIFFPPAS